MTTMTPTSPDAARPASSGPLASRVSDYQQRIEDVLARALDVEGGATPRLLEAMRYSTLAGGKRVRPVLVYATGEALGAPLERLDAAAAAVELIHVYSLVHDDLPAMDDDDLRRGRPTCHRAFDEATAILTGDALQARAFEVLAHASTAIPANARIEMLRLLADAIGTRGMAGGQAIDLAAVRQELTEAALERMHRQKTGALIQASVELGAVSAGLADAAERAALAQFGAEIGLAFQIQDDILDVEGNTDTLGKRAGADAERVKPTYPSVLGLEAARVQALARRDRAIAALAPWGARYANLREFAGFLVSRAS
ncbi:MAG TPA: farnesyl diphosphate synthase [Steroidobacteraceae bacterium]|jgi:farnesyl diphosphate synthase/geranylgeranyl diphosphate synthase type II|nr:farnesyl diphosphate synthase [Steroidobacteraceae bacterium]